MRGALVVVLLLVASGCTYSLGGDGTATEALQGAAGANCDRASASPEPGTVLVYMTKREFVGRSFPGDRRNYVAISRPLSREKAEAPLRFALDKLLEGPAPIERHLGCASMFDDQEHLLRRVALDDGHAVVDFHGRAFLDELATVSTSHAGAVFMTQLGLTIFQFPQIESVRFELDGDCLAFGDFMQAGVCMTTHRSDLL